MFAATGLEGDVDGVNNTLTAVGQYLGVGLGVAGLGLVARAQQADGDEQQAGAPATSSTPPAAASAKGGGGKQTIAGGVTGAKNPRKQFPGLPKKRTEADVDADARNLGGSSAAAAGGRGGATPGRSKRSAESPAAAAATEAKKDGGGGGGGGLMSGLMSGLRGNGGKASSTASRKCSYTWGAAEAMGPREYMEDAWCVKDTGFAGGYFFASVMDGMAETHGTRRTRGFTAVPRPQFLFHSKTLLSLKPPFSENFETKRGGFVTPVHIHV